MAVLVKKYRLSVTYSTYNYENEDNEENTIELIVRDAPYLSDGEADAIAQYFDGAYVSENVEVLDSWYEIV